MLQLDILRHLWSNTVDGYPVPLGNNYRPQQPLNGRKVYRSISDKIPVTRATGTPSSSPSMQLDCRLFALVLIAILGALRDNVA